MLKGISPLLSPELLKVLAEMGHGDTLVLSDAHFPACSMGIPVLRADGIPVTDLLDAILPVWELDAYVEHPVLMMAPVPGDTPDPQLSAGIAELCGKDKIGFVERFAFYEQAKRAHAVVVTGETRKYGNVLIQKGVIPLS